MNRNRRRRVMTALLAAVMLFSFLGSHITVQALTLNYLETARISGSQVTVTGVISTISEDGLVHIYAQYPYESGTEGTEVASAAYGKTTWTFSLGFNTSSSVLNKKFQAVIVKDGELTAVGNAIYITNPEAVADNTSSRMDYGIKGILPAATLINSDSLATLGVQQATYNMTLGRLVSGSGITYTYNGRTYSFSSTVVGEYDIVVQRLNAQGVQISMVVLNDLASNTTLLHPQAQTGTSANYYALNAATESGVQLLEAVMSFLAERYSGTTGHGQVDNWIIGNEVNAYTQWNYMSSPSLSYYAQEYANAFRVCYNAIKSQNANANVYVCTDQQWATASNSSLYYGSRPFLVAFNSVIRKMGNIDWRVAAHPYNVPLYDANNWTSSSYATHSQSSSYLTIRNIDVLTDFLSQSSLLSPSGQVRTVKLSEVGYTSSSSYGEAGQAAAITLAYLQASANQYVDGLIISRQLDDASEIAEGLALGLLNVDGSAKLSYTYYMYLGNADYVSAASALVGVDLTTQVTSR